MAFYFGETSFQTNKTPFRSFETAFCNCLFYKCFKQSFNPSLLNDGFLGFSCLRKSRTLDYLFRNQRFLSALFRITNFFALVIFGNPFLSVQTGEICCSKADMMSYQAVLFCENPPIGSLYFQSGDCEFVFLLF